jgi:hypothetical protein
MDIQHFSCSGHQAFVIRPSHAGGDTSQPWVWYAPTLPGLPGEEEDWMFQRLGAAGIAIAGIDVGESFGNPQGRATYTALHEELVRLHGFSPKPCLLARSRGGLMLYNWAVEHPRWVACVAGIYPVCNLVSYPGLERASAAYDLSEAELAASLEQHSPFERIAPLARAGVPIMHLHGDRDEVVPLEQNSLELQYRYRQHGGHMQLAVIAGQGHNYWPGWFQSQALVDFIIGHARPGPSS